MLNSEGVFLEYKAATGEVLSYRTVMHSKQRTEENNEEISSSNVAMEMTTDQKIVKVSGNTFDLDVHVTDGFIERNKQRLPLPTIGQTIGMTVEKNGNITRSTVNANINQPIFPSGLQKKGSTWTEHKPLEIPLGEKGQTVTIDLEYVHTLVSLETEQDYDVAIIVSHAGPTKANIKDGISQSIEVSARVAFAYELGQMISSHLESKTVVSAPDLVLTTVHTIDTVLESLQSPLIDDTPSAADNAFIIGF
ncbi:MAG: hypothetical protein ACI376_06010 [Candidatus Bruticola sp.]